MFMFEMPERLKQEANIHLETKTRAVFALWHSKQTPNTLSKLLQHCRDLRPGNTNKQNKSKVK